MEGSQPPRARAAYDRWIIESVTEFAIIATDRHGVVTEWNAGAERILGWTADEMIGGTTDPFFTPEDRASGQILREMVASLETGRGLDERWHLRKDGTGFWASGEMMPLRDEAGEHVGFVKVVRDRTEEVVAQRARRESQEQLEAIFSQAPSFMALLRGPRHRFERVNPGYTRTVGGRDVVGRTVAEALPEAADQGFVHLLDEVYRTGVAYQSHGALFAMQAAPDGPIEDRYLDFVYQPIRDADGAINGIFVEGIDVTDRILSARRLRDTEDRYRALAENVDVGMCVVEIRFDEGGKPIDYRIIDGNPAFERHTGLYGSVGKWVSEVAPGLEQHWFDLYGQVALTGRSARFENGAEGLGQRWFEVEAHRVGEPDRHHVAILFTDITQRKRADERRTLLSHELAHRLKNTLAVVQSIATQTLRSAPDLASARTSLNQRIQALSKAHDILLTGRSDGGTIRAIVRNAIAPHDPDARIALHGPDLSIGSSAALTLALVMHDQHPTHINLGTFTRPEGTVDVVWDVIDRVGPRPLVELSWRERNGPPVAVPSRKGFGSRLIEAGLTGSPGGSATLAYERDGVFYRLTAPLAELQIEDD